MSQFDGKASAALPVLAAQVEIGQLRASAYLEVRGYPCDKVAKYLGAGLPKFDVTGYSDLSRRIERLQALVTGDSASIVPEKLAVEESPTDALGGVGTNLGAGLGAGPDFGGQADRLRPQGRRKPGHRLPGRRPVGLATSSAPAARSAQGPGQPIEAQGRGPRLAGSTSSAGFSRPGRSARQP